MKHTFVTTIVLVGPLLWTTALLPPAAAQVHTAAPDLVCLSDPVAVPGVINSNTGKKLPGQFSGNVSWYGAKFNGKKTASGEIFNMNKLTGAHLRLPLPTRVLCENPRSGQVTVIRVNDRGPHVKNRVMDVSHEGGKQLGILVAGIGYIECMVLPTKPVDSKASHVNSGVGDNR